MPVRYPPNKVPQGRVSRDPRAGRIVSYAEPHQGFIHRTVRRLLSPIIVIPVVVIGAIVLGVLIYYWTVFSSRIDNLLAGEVFTRSAGIYAAPKQLRLNESTSPEQLIDYLKRAGYVEKGQQADNSRGRFALNGGTVEIEPSSASSVDGQKQFHHVRIQFSRNGKSITSLADLDGGGALQKTWLEPELISSVTG